jgi:tetratricopeptide (TPR) repeat protein
LIAGDALAFYFSKFVWPAWLGPDYGRSPAFVIEQAWRWLLWLLPIAALGLFAALPGRRQWLAAAAIFVAALSPMLGLIPFAGQNASTVADRYVYLAMLGPALALAGWLAARSGWRYFVPVAVMLAVFAALDFRQVGVWHDDDAWTARTLEVNPRSWFGLEARAHALERAGKRDEALALRLVARRENSKAVEPCFRLAESWSRVGDWPRAVQCYRDALAIAPDNRLIHGYLALALVQAGDNAGAMQQFHLAVDGLQRDRNLSALCSTLGSRLMERGTVDAARAVLNESLRLRPRSVEALNTLAVLEFRQRRLPEALAFCNAALAIDPQSAATRANRGVFLVAGGQTEAGLSELMRAVELAPRDVATRGTLADALLRSGQPAAAIEQFRQGLRLQVDWWEGCWRLGWLLATLPDDRLRNGREALELATRYRAASGERDPRALDLLAAAEAEMGDFDRATTSARRAVELWRAADSGGAAVVAAEQRVRQYERQMAWREPPLSGR